MTANLSPRVLFLLLGALSLAVLAAGRETLRSVLAGRKAEARARAARTRCCCTRRPSRAPGRW